MSAAAQAKPFVIAIDGPAASGKGTLARRIAQHYGLRHLDTGLTYRAVAHRVLASRGDLADERGAVAAAEAVDFDTLDSKLLSTHEVGEAASRVAVIPALRRVLVAKQRAFAQRLPGAVLDGRDIGTVVCPDAAAKLYVTASAAVRAARRGLEMRAAGSDITDAAILHDLQRRDARDMARTDSPLRPADDASLLDTSELDIEAAFRAAVETIDCATAR